MKKGEQMKFSESKEKTESLFQNERGGKNVTKRNEEEEEEKGK